MKRNNVISGALILSVGAVLAKVFSAIYRIILTRILGGVGIGLYQLVFPLYSLCVVLATAGLPMAVSKVVATYPNNAKKLVKKCLLFTSLMGLIVTIVLLLIGNTLPTITSQENLSVVYLLLAPTIVVISTASVLRGYFQGMHNFVPSAVSNIIEQFVKMIVGLVLSLSLLSLGLLPAIMGAMFGIMISEIVSLVVLVLYYKRTKDKSKANIDISYKELIVDILPITITNILLPIATFVDSIIVVKLLGVNFSEKVSIFLYGLESGAVSSLASIPTIFSFSIASVLLPNIASNEHTWNKNYKLSLCIKIILAIIVPCVICFTFIPDRLIGVLYANRLDDLGINGTKIASSLLGLSGLGMMALAINQIYSSSLQAVNERFVTIRNMIIGIVVKFVIELIFLPTKMLNIYSLVIANTVCYLIVVSLNHMEIKRYFNLRINHIYAGKLLLSNFLMFIAMISILALNNSFANTILAGVVGIMVYLLSIVKFKLFKKNDMAILKYKV